ncbi:hypothetical protein BDV27DRAFT_149017 [Aspergillus caelatus]|uniref:Rhodopsin domain-containing protein n=2 Tax=Aspergillus subgen. Circumdati TaxID=2720871 RepID=A0A5N6ZT32_9EURO|nr:uncharacterized protein BDV27DRAFT_149017 [Aspergillus caelatus]KAE8360079.1 hypothetical protein BDV27DRAFT_149017 [Aspergillus caelatus]KAE8413528.1 hypothetical protein BDV36DRAFT_304066 [Aspergillus pseudocaelatus]
MANDKSEAIIIVTSIFLALSFLTVSLRCYVRLHLIRAFGADDYMMVLAMAFNIAFAICGIAGASTGLGKKMNYFADKPNDLKDSLRFWWVGQIFYALTGTAGRTSIAISLLRITVVRVHLIIIYSTIALSIAVGLLFFFATLLECRPIHYVWDYGMMSSHCVSKDFLLDIVYTHSVIAALCDLTLGILPLFMIWKLQMNRRAKFSLGVILGLGCLAGAAVVIRLPYNEKFKDPDFLYATATLSILANIEAGLGITAGCLSTLRPLVRMLRGGSSNPSQGRNAGSSIPLSRSRLARKERQKLSHHESGTCWADVPNDGYKNITTSTTILGSRATKRDSSEESLTPRYLPPTVTVQNTFEVSVAEH